MTLVADTAGRGPKIVLIHGGLSARRVWGYQLLALSRDFEVTALDLPGHGSSPWIRRGRWFDDAVAAVASAPALAGTDPVTLVGWSIGASVAATVAATRPGSRLVVVGANVEPQTDQATAAIERLSLGDFPRYAHGVARMFSAAASADTEQWLVSQAQATPIDVAVASLTTAPPVTDLASDAVVIHGDHDMITPVAHRPTGGAADHVLERAGHAVFLDAKDRFNAIVAAVAGSPS
ncbi:MAG TPA: alpha/beta hydrolase [Ilumatobacter sp.]|nr:alpha/beta hydrolase [Ilumatobacter sp.]